MLGVEVCRELRERRDSVVAADLLASKEVVSLDICDFDAVDRMVKEHAPDFIFHLAAETNVDLCEQRPDHAFRVNALGTENVALASQKYNVALVYISTAGVFDGSKIDPYTEFDQPDPINVYGQTKFAGEQVAQRLNPRHFVFRAGWMVGGWNIDKKFVYKVAQQILQGSQEIKAVNDKFGNPTFTSDFAGNLIDVVKTYRYGLYHLCGQGSCSRYEIACKIVEFMGVGNRVRVEPVSSALFPLPAARPRSEVMRSYKLDLLGLNKMPHWEAALRSYITANTAKEPALLLR